MPAEKIWSSVQEFSRSRNFGPMPLEKFFEQIMGQAALDPSNTTYWEFLGDMFKKLGSIDSGTTVSWTVNNKGYLSPKFISPPKNELGKKLH